MYSINKIETSQAAFMYKYETLGRAVGPAVSLHGRWPPPKVAPTPAPCDYEPSKAARAVLDHAPAFSIGLRVSPPQPGIKTPGVTVVYTNRHFSVVAFLFVDIILVE